MGQESHAGRAVNRACSLHGSDRGGRQPAQARPRASAGWARQRLCDHSPADRPRRRGAQAWTLATNQGHGGDHGNQHTGGKNNNVHLAAPQPQGNSREAALRRLAKEVAAGNEAAAQMREAVLAGMKSAHGALVELGLRRRAIASRTRSGLVNCRQCSLDRPHDAGHAKERLLHYHQECPKF